MSFMALILHNITVRKVRLTLTALAVAVGVLTVVSLGVVGIQHLPSLRGVLHTEYTTGVFGRALFTAAAMALLGGLAPSLRAARAKPLEALRHE